MGVHHEVIMVENNSTSTSNLVVQPERLSKKIKRLVKGPRPVFRTLFGLRALREGIKGYVKGRRGAKDHLAATISFISGSNTVAGRPMNITIEPTSACNLACPICETGDRRLERPMKHMTMDDFKTIIDKIAPHTNTLMFYFMGEPFINQDSYAMLRYAKDKGIPFITTCTNGDFVNAEKLIDSGIDEISFQMGGLTQETHQTYRINSNLERVMKNLQETIRVRNERKSKLIIKSGLIIMKHNEHEVVPFLKQMKDLGVDQPHIVDTVIRTYEEGVKYLPTDQSHWKYDPEAFKQGVVKPRFLPPNACPWIYYSLSIHVNGNVVPCCWDPTGKYVMGNLVTESLDAVWNGPKFRAFRDQLHKDQGQIEICKLCSSYPHSPIR